MAEIREARAQCDHAMRTGGGRFAALRHDTAEVPSGRYPAVVVRRSFRRAAEGDRT
jgi:hypothetical protein